MKWHGDYLFVISNLVQKDFKIRYRNMSLGVFWSLLNPLIMMGVLTFIFTRIFPNTKQPLYPLSILCGLIPFNFFAMAWISGTNSLIESASLLKRVPVPRQIFPVASVISNCLHLVIQLTLLLVLVIVFGSGLNWYWLWLPVIWFLFILFLAGLALACSALNIYIRDMRYVVESANTVLFWLVPIFYSFAMIPGQYKNVYEFNPVAALVMLQRNILLEGHAPASSTLLNLTTVAAVTLGMGIFIFGRLQKRFYEYL
jgi:lipopolysaccharide transport system permease protein